MHRLDDARREALFGYWVSRGATDPRVLERATRGGPLRRWLPHLAQLVWGRSTPALATARYVFSGHKYRTLIEALPRDEVALVAMKPAHVRYARERGFPAQTVFDARPALAANFPEMRRPGELDRAFDALVRAFGDGAGRFLVLQTDSNPINRLLLFAAREAGLQTVCIQHGIFTRGSPPLVVDGWTADFMLVYDPHQQSVLADKGMARERLPVLGFYERPVEAPLPPPPAGRGRRLCVMGQPFANFQPEQEARYMEILRRAFPDLRAAGFEVVFKPHPREKGQPYLAEFGEPFDGSMGEALRHFDVCISFTSTALLEATFAGRVAIQIHDALFRGDRLDEAGYAHTLESSELAALPELCAQAPPVDNPALELLSPEALARRFVDLLASLDDGAPPHGPPLAAAG